MDDLHCFSKWSSSGIWLLARSAGVRRSFIRCRRLSSLDFSDDVSNGEALHEFFSFLGIVAGSGAELVQETDRIHDPDLFDESIRGPLRDLGDRQVLCTHSTTSRTSSNTETTLQRKLNFALACFNKRSSHVAK